MAVAAWNMLGNGSGGIDWAGLPLACAYLGVSRIEPLIDRLLAIREVMAEPGKE